MPVEMGVQLDMCKLKSAASWHMQVAAYLAANAGAAVNVHQLRGFTPAAAEL